MSTYSPKKSEIERNWHLVDADGLILGRMASEIAKLLRGKHKPTYSPHIDVGDHVVIINADKVVLSSGKAEKRSSIGIQGFLAELNRDLMLTFLNRIPPMRSAKLLEACCPKTGLGANN